MYELKPIDLDKLLKLKPALDIQANQEQLTQAVSLYGLSLPIINRETMRLLTSRDELKALETIRSAAGMPPRGVDSNWQVMSILGQWNEHEETRAALRFNGGIDHYLSGQPDTGQIMNLILDYDGSDFNHLGAIGLDLEQYAGLLDAIIEEPPAQPEPAAAPLITGWGIPTLDHWRQATETPAPLIKWGSQSRAKAAGTVHFYTDDYKFAALIEEPAGLLKTGCKAAIEINISTSPYMPRALALHGIYQKRAVSRDWQRAGINIIVDLNIEPEFFDLALLGVPKGWRAYANRWHGDPDHLTAAHALAVDHAGGPVLYIVYGGGQQVKNLCSGHGWQWIPEQAQTARGLWDAEEKRLS